MTTNDILDSIYVNNKLHHDVLQPNFFQKRNIENVYNAILCNTSFLNDYAPSLRERIFYIENGYTDIKRCGYCEINKLKFNGKTNPFSKTCLSPECVSKHRTAVAFKKWSSNPRRIQYIDSKCIGCGCIYKKPKQSNKQYCNQHCWTQTGEYTHTESTKIKIRNTNKLVHNSIEFKERHKDTYRLARVKQSDTMKRKIANGEFTPCVTNSWTRWKATLRTDDGIKKFRSSWEVAFYSMNSHLKYEITRIPYTYQNSNHTYIVDFTDIDNKILYEIKPKSLHTVDRNIIKYDAALNWCTRHGYTYIIIDDDWFIHNKDNFDTTKYPELTSVIQHICKKK
jgi:hypothetical protein